MQIVKKIVWSFNCGFHQTRIVGARLTKECINGKEEDGLKLVFEITSLVHPTKRYMAKRFYRTCDSRLLIDDLEDLLGDDINSVINLAGEIIPEALCVLEGKAADIEIEHHHGKNHDEPFCLVTQVRKPGTLIADIGQEAA